MQVYLVKTRQCVMYITLPIPLRTIDVGRDHGVFAHAHAA